MSSSTNNNSIQTECPICLDSYTTEKASQYDRIPLLLTACGHTICKFCLNGILDDALAHSSSKIKCPICRKQSLAKGIDKYNKNYALLALLENQEVKELKPEATRIKICDENPNHTATIYCKSCKACYCAHCWRATHTTQIFQRHDRVSIREAEDMASMCSQHSNYPLDLYCVQDQQIICLMCFTHGSHKDHEYQFTADIKAQARAEMLESLKKLDSLQSESEKMRHWIMGLESELDVCATATAHTLQSSKQAILSAVNSRFHELEQQLIRIHQEKHSQLQQKRNEIDNFASTLSTLKGDAVATCSSEVHKLLLYKDDFLRQIGDLEYLPWCDSYCGIAVDMDNATTLQAIENFGKVGIEPPSILTASSNEISWSSTTNACEYEVKAPMVDTMYLLHMMMRSIIFGPVRYKGSNTRFEPAELEQGFTSVAVRARVGTTWTNWSQWHDLESNIVHTRSIISDLFVSF